MVARPTALAKVVAAVRPALARACQQRSRAPPQEASALQACSSHEDATAAEVSPEAWASDHWPDGTPKKFKGRDKWKNWVDWDSSFKEQTDELNRLRHYFFEVDSRGRLFRKELHRLEETDGSGDTALIAAAKHGQRDCVELLLEAVSA